jgi:hypothetical protein
MSNLNKHFKISERLTFEKAHVDDELRCVAKGKGGKRGIQMKGYNGGLGG